MLASSDVYRANGRGICQKVMFALNHGLVGVHGDTKNSIYDGVLLPAACPFAAPNKMMHDAVSAIFAAQAAGCEPCYSAANIEGCFARTVIAHNLVNTSQLLQPLSQIM